MHDLFTMIWKELIQVSNRPRFALQKAIIALVLAGALVLMALSEIYGRNDATYQAMAQFGRNTFLTLTAIVAIVLPLAAMVFGSDIVVSEHVRKRLSLLLVTPLKGPAIIGSKVLTVFGRVLVGIVVALPVVAMLQIFGGVDRKMVITASVFILANIWLYGSLGLMLSVLCRSTVAALARGGVFVVVWNLLPALGLLIFELMASSSRGSSAGSPGITIAGIVFPMSPFYTFVTIAEPSAAFGVRLFQPIVVHAIIDFVFGAVFIAIAFVAFRPIAMRLVSGAPLIKRRFFTRREAAKEAKKKANVMPVNPVLGRLAGRLDNCVFAKETCHWRPLRISPTLLWLFVPWAFMLLVSSVGSHYPDLSSAEDHWPLFVFEAGGLLFLLSVIAATRVAREKEARTLQVLVLTRLGAARILAGKAAALILDQILPLTLVAAHLAFITWLDLPSPLDVAVRVAGLAVSVLFSVMLGLYFSLACKSAAMSVVLTAIAWFGGVYAGIFPIVVLSGMLGMHNSEMNLAGSAFPLLIGSALAVVLTLLRSRRRGFGAWLPTAAYACLSATVYLAVISWQESTSSWGGTAIMIVLPASSILSWDAKVNGVGAAYFALPVQIAICVWMATSFLMSFEAQAKRES